jgi:excisionase family DNA binding protein
MAGRAQLERIDGPADAESAASAKGLSDGLKPASPKRRSRRRDAGRLLDLKEAEVYSGISAWTLRELIASGDLPVVRAPGLRRVWIDRADLDKAIGQWKDRAG